MVTRPRHQADPLSRELRERGARVVEYPTIRIRPPREAAPLRRALERVERYDWAVFTSVNGVRHVLDELGEIGRDVDAFDGVRLAAIGPSTAGALREAGLAVEVVPGEYRAEALADAVGRAGGDPEPHQHVRL
ncbi:MAG: uroporphyrinogen-III synthase, partial [Gemmatimonadota bacterium]